MSALHDRYRDKIALRTDGLPPYLLIVRMPSGAEYDWARFTTWSAAAAEAERLETCTPLRIEART